MSQVRTQLAESPTKPVDASVTPPPVPPHIADELSWWRKAIESDAKPLPPQPEPPPGFGATADIQVVTDVTVCAWCWLPTPDGAPLHVGGCHDRYWAEMCPPESVGWSV